MIIKENNMWRIVVKHQSFWPCCKTPFVDCSNGLFGIGHCICWGIRIGGKVREVEEFISQPLSSVVAEKTITTRSNGLLVDEGICSLPRSHVSTSGSSSAWGTNMGKRCMECPIYRTGGSAHGENLCPLRNGKRDQKRPIPGTQYSQAQLPQPNV